MKRNHEHKKLKIKFKTMKAKFIIIRRLMEQLSTENIQQLTDLLKSQDLYIENLRNRRFGESLGNSIEIHLPSAASEERPNMRREIALENAMAAITGRESDSEQGEEEEEEEEDEALPSMEGSNFEL